MVNLRRTAEAKLAGERLAHPPQAETNTWRLQHELEIYQIELELQNDQLRAAQSETAAALNRYMDLFEFAPVGYFNLDADGTIHLVNLKGAKLVGVERARLLGKRLGLLVHTTDRKAFNDFLVQVFATGTKQTCELSLEDEDRAQVIVHLEATASIDGKECRTVMTDITNRKLLEEQVRQAQKMEAVGTLAGGIAHDFNNILAAINGYTELAMMTLSDNPKVHEHLGSVLQAADRATGLVRQILAFSRQQDAVRHPIILGPLAAECIALLRAKIPATIEFDTSIAPDAPLVLANATHIHQILMNLGANAWHAMKDHNGRLEVKLERCVVDAAHAAKHVRLHPGVYALLSIGDTGCGMDARTLQRIFEPFFTTKPFGESTGMGLAMIHGIMNHHEGAITVQSTPGKGTVFQLYFPEKICKQTTPANTGKPVPRGHGERLLVVDDEDMVVQLTQMTLTELGYEVETATKPADAIARVLADPRRFALVLTDQTMPGMTGLVLAAKLQVIRPGLPVILTTGYIASLTPEQTQAAGIRQLLPKPASLHALATAIQAALPLPTKT